MNINLPKNYEVTLNSLESMMFGFIGTSLLLTTGANIVGAENIRGYISNGPEIINNLNEICYYGVMLSIFCNSYLK